MRNTDELQCQPVITTLNIRADLSPVFLYPDFHSWPEGRRRLPILVDQYTVSVTPSS